MKTIIKILVLFFYCCTFFSVIAKAQDSTYSEIIIKNDVYKPGSGWLKIGEGYGYNTVSKTFELNTFVSFSFRIKNYYAQTGYHVSSDKFFTQKSLQKLNNLYIAAGMRKESQKSNISVFAGPSYSYGGYLFDTDSLGEKRYKGFTEMGLVVIADYTFKIFYDLGFGLSLYGSINKHYNVVGIQAHFYLSGAFKGEIR